MTQVSVASSSAADPAMVFVAALAENLAGRRTLERTDHGIEAEPATLAQLAPMPRIDKALRGLYARQHASAAIAQTASEQIMSGLIGELARRDDLHVATWRAGERALAALADLLEALASDGAAAGISN
jgi:hypothetical protein